MRFILHGERLLRFTKRNTCIVYTSSPPPPPGSVSVTTYTTTGTNGIASTITSSTTLPPSPTGPFSVTTFTTTGTNGIASTITSSTTLPAPPPGSVSTTTYTTTLPNGIVSTVTSQTTIPRSVQITTYTTTGTNGIVSTVTSSTTVPSSPPPPPASSTSVITFVTTNTAGSIITTSRNTVITPPVSSNAPPPPPPTTSAITFVTTNTAGSIITTSRNTVITPPVSSNAPPPPPTSVVVVSSTNQQVSVIVASSTSTAAGPYYSQACGGKYSDNFGQLWCLQCQTAYFFNDLTSIVVGSFEECLEACDTYVPSPDRARGASCIAITWGPRTVGGECYRKFNVTDSRLDRRQDSAYKCDQAAVPPSASSIINTNTANIASTGASSGVINTNTANIASTRASTPASSAPIGASSVPVSSNPIVPTTRPTTPATSNPIVPPTSNAISPVTSNPNVPTTRATTPVTSNANSPVTSSPNVPATTPATSNPGVPATLISSATTATSVNLELAFQPCPSSNGQQFVNQLGNVYDIACGCDYQFSDLSGATHQDYFQDCILACDRYVPDPNRARGAPCIGVSWGSPAGNPGGNCFLKYRIEQIRCGEPRFCAAVKHDYVFTSGVISTSRVTATASVVPVPTTSSNAGNGGFTATPIATLASLSTSQPAVVAPSSSTSPPAVVVPSSSTSRALVVSSSNPPAVVPPSSTVSTFTPVNTFAPPQISRTVSCPAQNGFIYTDIWGQAWEVRCGMNIRGTNAKSVHADSWEKCLQFCDILGGIVGVTYPGGGGDNPNLLSQNCYPYQAFTEFVSGAVPTLCAARPLNVSTGSFFNTEQLCPTYDNETFTDAYSRTYQIRCDHSVGGTALSPTITKTLEGCLSYCSTYNTCVGVQFTQYIERDRVDNCFPKSSAGALSYSVGTSCAQLLT
ncbi:MAG: hypothetical protein Q9226_002087 [Calogaya cf. arnoldii]